MFNDKNENNELDINEAKASDETAQQEQEQAAETVEAAEETAIEESPIEEAVIEETVVEEAPIEEISEKPRKSMSKKAKYTLTFSTVAVLFIVAVIVLNLLCGALSARVNMSIDLTPGKILELSDETINVLDNLEKRVSLYSLIPEVEDDTLEAIDKTLLRYQQKSGKVRYVKVDTVADPQFLASYLEDGQQINEYSIIVECDSKYKIIDVNNIVMVDQSTGELEYLAAEQRITSAIMHVTTDADAKIGIVQGHDEVNYETFDSVVLDAENYDVVSVNILSDGIPEDVDMLIIPSPTKDFHAQEIEALDAFLDNGGKAQLILDSSMESAPVLKSYLAEWGASVYSDAYVYEQNPSNYMNYPSNIIAEVEMTDVTESFIGNLGMIVYPMARGIKIEDVHGVDSTVLLASSNTSFAKMNTKTSSAEKEDVDIDGPITLAAMLTKDNVDNKPALMVMGGTGLFSTFGTSSFSNADFYYNILSYMTDGGETIFIRPKDISPTHLAIPAINAIVLSVVVILVIPIAILIAGLVIWSKRRHL